MYKNKNCSRFMILRRATIMNFEKGTFRCKFIGTYRNIKNKIITVLCAVLGKP